MLTDRLADDDECAERAYSVTDVLAAARSLIEHHARSITLRAELSEWRQYASGHCYGTLRDRNNELSLVLYRGDASRVRRIPEVGDNVIVSGRLSVHDRHGKLQLVVRAMKVDDGVGDSLLAREKLLVRLRREGLLEAGRKQKIPSPVAAIGVVTSRQSAGLGDIVAVVSSRAPWVRVIVAEASVQGPDAPASIATALTALAESELVTLIILARGGGSATDLAPFDTEVVARAIAAAAIPVVSAVGHELHTTIADAVADARAATPSAAAAMVTPDQRELRRTVAALHEAAGAAVQRASCRSAKRHADVIERLAPAMAARVAITGARVDGIQPERTLSALMSLVVSRRQASHIMLDNAAMRIAARVGLVSIRCDSAHLMAQRAVMQKLACTHGMLAARSAAVDGASPIRRLAAGYAFVERSDGKPVTSATAVSPGDNVTLFLVDGVVRAVVSTRAANTPSHTEPK